MDSDRDLAIWSAAVMCTVAVVGGGIFLGVVMHRQAIVVAAGWALATAAAVLSAWALERAINATGSDPDSPSDTLKGGEREND